MVVKRLSKLPRSAKRIFFLFVDSALVPISLYAAFAARYGTIFPLDAIPAGLPLFPLMAIVGIIAAATVRLDRIMLNAFDTSGVARIALVAVLLAVCAIILSYMLGLSVPRSIPLMLGVIFFFLAVTGRIVGLALLRRLYDLQSTRKPVAIYGAGAAGIQLAAALRQAQEARPVFLVDDNPSLIGLMIAGLRVYHPRDLAMLVRRQKIERVLLAVPSMAKDRRLEVLGKLKTLNIEVLVLPSYVELMADKGIVDSLRPVTPDQLLGRDMVALDTPEIAKTYAGRSILVTGAGGSIGSELCRQLMHCNPASIILFEQSEFQLYQIDQELRSMAQRLGVKIICRLGSVTDRARVTEVIKANHVEIILHAAAYKHVPLVEENEIEGARNNVSGTQVVAEAASAAGVERFILISTDKAVRPTNVMGATKRMAELVVQDIQTRTDRTKYAMVRFGNVLGSSGSVLPLFQKQIANGGPLTVTHRDVTRFFMTIPEAARLVLLAGAYAKGGDVFVLDMGEPKKIIDIARNMIALSGRKVKDEATGEGEIAIEFTGLRPGEKLYEELLIDHDSLVRTPHPKILRAKEAMLSQIEVAAMMRELELSVDNADADQLRRLIMARVEGYHLQSENAETG